MKKLITTKFLKQLVLVSLFGLAGCQSPAPTEEPNRELATGPPLNEIVFGETQEPASACECPVHESEACPQLAVASKENNVTIDDLLLVGRVENVSLLPQELKLKAKIDTGAKTSSLHAQDLTSFERDGKAWVRFSMLDPKTKKKIYFERPLIRNTKVKQQDTDLQLRPTVSMSISFGPIEEQVDFTLADRTGYLYQVLIGRNFLRDRAIVDVSRTFIASSME
jgi:hypothetical protein